MWQAALCAELVGSFAWEVAEAAALLREALGWEANAIDTAVGIAVIVSKRGDYSYKYYKYYK